MPMRPLNDRLVVRPRPAEETIGSGRLEIPDTAREKPLEGTVISVGPGLLNETTGLRMPLDIQLGERVIYSKYAGAEFELDGETVLLLNESDILAVLS